MAAIEQKYKALLIVNKDNHLALISKIATRLKCSEADVRTSLEAKGVDTKMPKASKKTVFKSSTRKISDNELFGALDVELTGVKSEGKSMHTVRVGVAVFAILAVLGATIFVKNQGNNADSTTKKVHPDISAKAVTPTTSKSCGCQLIQKIENVNPKAATLAASFVGMVDDGYKVPIRRVVKNCTLEEFDIFVQNFSSLIHPSVVITLTSDQGESEQISSVVKTKIAQTEPNSRCLIFSVPDLSSMAQSFRHALKSLFETGQLLFGETIVPCRAVLLARLQNETQLRVLLPDRVRHQLKVISV